MEQIKAKINRTLIFLGRHEDMISQYNYTELNNDFKYLEKNINVYDIQTCKLKLNDYELIKYIKDYLIAVYDYIENEFNRIELKNINNAFIDDFDLI
jgi:hypothetical protein